MQIFQALGDENRWKILVAVAEVGELPCRDLDDLLSVSKATISYHARLLTQAGLITVRKQGRNSFYALDVERIRYAMDKLDQLAGGDGEAELGQSTNRFENSGSGPLDESITLTTW